MGAVTYRVGRWLGSTVRSSAVLVVVVAVLAAVPLALAAGARRTATAPDRYESASGNPIDVRATQESGPVLAEEITALPAVRSVEPATFVFGQLALPDGEPYPDHIVFAGSAVAYGDRLVAGRQPDPQVAGEFVVAKPFAEANDLRLGAIVLLATLSEEQVAESGFNPRPDMLVTDAVLVGLIDGPADLNDPADVAIFSPSLLDDPRIGTSGSVLGIDLADGASEAELRVQLDTVPGGELLLLEVTSIVTAETRSAVRTQALGLSILAALAAVATVVALGQLLVRHTRLTDDETSILSSLGATRAHLVAETTIRAGLVVALAIPLAAAVAVAASGIFPFDFVRRVEPRPGPRLDAVVLVPGALLLAVALTGSVMLATRLRRVASRPHDHPLVDGIAARCHSTSMATGVRFAYASTDTASTASRLGTAVLMVAAVVGTLTFAVSLRSLATERARYGANFDALISLESDVFPAELLTLLRTDPDITDVTMFTTTLARAEGDDHSIYVIGAEPARGALEPHRLAGRLPVGPEEIAVGRVSARNLDAEIGDPLTLSDGARRAQYEITGIVVPPQVRGSDRVGEGAIVTPAGFARIDPDRSAQAAGIRLRDGASAEAVRERIGEAVESTDWGDPAPPSRILNIARTTYVPFVLAVLLAVLVVVTVLTAVYSGVRRRTHDVAVLRSLGADRGWLVRAAQWHAVAATVVPIAIGVPLGIVAGRLVFRGYADSLGTVDDAVLPIASLVVGATALVVAGTVGATVGGRRARRARPAELLRAE